MTQEEIKDMMLYGERINVEYKEAFNELPKSFWETYSSFANTIGGQIVLGIKEHRTKLTMQERFEIQGGKQCCQNTEDPVGHREQ